MKECFDKEMRTGPQSSRRSISVGFGTAAAGVFHKTDKRPSNFDQKARSDYSFKRNKNGPGCGAIFLVRDRGRHCYAPRPPVAYQNPPLKQRTQCFPVPELGQRAAVAPVGLCDA
jgi:hypothetical protein